MLIQFDNLSGYAQLKVPKNVVLFYYGTPLELEMPQDTDNSLPLGKVLLTKMGQELATICGSQPIPEFMDYVKEKWKAYLPKPKTDELNKPSAASSEP